MSRIHRSPRKPPSAPRAQASARPAQPERRPAAKPEMPKLSQRQLRDTFERLDRNNNKRIDLQELVGAHHTLPANPGKLHGDRNGDNAISFGELKKLEQKSKADSQRSNKEPSKTVEHPGVYRMPEGQSATIRSHASGMVLGRVQGSDVFVASHKRGNYVYGHVKGHPDRKGWVLASQLPKSSRAPTTAERKAGTNEAVDLRRKAGGLDYLNGNDKKVLQVLQQDLSLSGEKFTRVGYTTPVKVKEPGQRIPLYANYPARPGNELRGPDGKPMYLSGNEDVKFRYTPDGKHAVVLARTGKEEGQGVWGIIDKSAIIIPEGTPGGEKPKNPIIHRG